ncbi:hypothetical protein [Streptomyces sp. NPDC015125]|uniref:hypothetical protein n=1 Tax=Streptomyces sp. NPDC015125 TaxID=3364938 RepID=UPI0036F6792B
MVDAHAGHGFAVEGDQVRGGPFGGDGDDAAVLVLVAVQLGEQVAAVEGRDGLELFGVDLVGADGTDDGGDGPAGRGCALDVVGQVLQEFLAVAVLREGGGADDDRGDAVLFESVDVVGKQFERCLSERRQPRTGCRPAAVPSVMG